MVQLDSISTSGLLGRGDCDRCRKALQMKSSLRYHNTHIISRKATDILALADGFMSLSPVQGSLQEYLTSAVFAASTSCAHQCKS